jgi:hypothetical protein
MENGCQTSDFCQKERSKTQKLEKKIENSKVFYVAPDLIGFYYMIFIGGGDRNLFPGRSDLISIISSFIRRLPTLKVMRFTILVSVT